MARNVLRLLDTTYGDVAFDAKQAAAVGAVMGNGAFNFASTPDPTGAGMGEAGNIGMVISSAGTATSATGADQVLAVFSLPAGCLDLQGRQITLMAQGSYVANANAKRTKIIWNPSTAVVGSTVGSGGTVVADSGANSPNGGGWTLNGTVTKYGAAGSNTQICTHELAQQAGTAPTPPAPSLSTANEAAPILIAVTGNPTTAAADIVINLLTVTGAN